MCSNFESCSCKNRQSKKEKKANMTYFGTRCVNGVTALNAAVSETVITAAVLTHVQPPDITMLQYTMSTDISGNIEGSHANRKYCIMQINQHEKRCGECNFTRNLISEFDESVQRQCAITHSSSVIHICILST